MANQEQTTNKRSGRTHGWVETVKTILLTATVSTAIAFMAGVQYQKAQDAQMQSGIKNALMSLKSLGTSR